MVKFVIDILQDSESLGHDRTQMADYLVFAMEQQCIITPNHFIPEANGLHLVKSGWEPEDSKNG